MNDAKATRSRERTLLAGRTKPRPATARNADELMDLAVEAAQSRHLPTFLEQFALRSARMLDASWGAVAVIKGRDTEFHEMPGERGPSVASSAEWLLSNAREIRGEIETRALPKEIATSL